MKSTINPEIKTKIKESSIQNNVKELLYELIDFEYEHIDEPNIKFKDFYKKSIDNWKKEEWGIIWF